MVKINNWDWKLGIIFCSSLIALAILTIGIILIIYDSLVIGSILIIIGLMIGIIVFVINWPETIVIDNEKIIVYHWGREINKIKWQEITEIFRKVIITRYKLNCYYFFSDGQDRFLDAKNGNEHFVVFRCPKKKECLFSKFTDLPIKDLEKED